MLFEHSLHRSKTPIDEGLNEYFPETAEPYSNVVEAARYSLLSDGKRLRPAMLLEFFRMFGGENNAAMPFACAIEMIHTYSLIHDDLPCMDDDDLRRGKPSCHRAFDEATAMLAGDALLTRAFEVMADAQNIPAGLALRAIAYIAGQCGANGMIGGQAIDLSLEGLSTVTQDLHNRMVSLKTAALFKAACVGGSILAGADDEGVKNAESFAESIGMAFQITDDILDISGIESVIGKPVGSDERSGKATFATVYGLEDSQELVLEFLSEARQSLDEMPRSEFLLGMCDWLGSRVR